MNPENPPEGENALDIGERSITVPAHQSTSRSRHSPKPVVFEPRGLNRPDIAEHHAKMNKINHPKRKQAPNSYSIYHQNIQQDLETEGSLIESIQGSKSTRAQNLRAVHAKKKFGASIEQERTHRQEQRLLSQERNEQRFNQTQHNRSYLAADDSIMVDDQEFDQNQSSKRSPRDPFGEPSFMNTSRTIAMPST